MQQLLTGFSCVLLLLLCGFRVFTGFCLCVREALFRQRKGAPETEFEHFVHALNGWSSYRYTMDDPEALRLYTRLMNHPDRHDLVVYGTPVCQEKEEPAGD